MLVRKLRLERSIQLKVAKHGVEKEEIERVLIWDEPKHFKAKGIRYMAIGRSERLVTVIFETYEPGVATIITAYPSSEWQRKLYERK